MAIFWGVFIINGCWILSKAFYASVEFIIYGLYYVEEGFSILIFFKSFNHKWVLNFVKGFLYFYWDYHMIFIFQFVNMVYHIDSVQSLSHVRLFETHSMDCSTPGLPLQHQLPEFTQTHVHWVGVVIQPSHALSSPSPPILNLSQHQGLFQWVGSSHQVAKVLELQLQHQSFQWIFRTKRKLQASITDEHRCKNPQQNFSKQNSATPQKAHTPWSSWVYSSNARILQYMQINQCVTPY